MIANGPRLEVVRCRATGLQWRIPNGKPCPEHQVEDCLEPAEGEP